MNDGVWMTKSNICSVIGTKTGSANCHTMTVTFAAREIEHVAHDYIFVRIVCAHPIGRMNRFLVKTFQVDGVRAVDRHSARVDMAAQRPDHAKILVLIITSKRGWEENQWQSATVSEYKHFEFAVQPRRVPFDVTFVH